MEKILSEIKAGNIQNVYLFYGEDIYKRRIYKEELKKALFSNEMNYSYFEGDGISWKAVSDECAPVPFFADKRLVIVENSGSFRTKAASKGAKGTDSELLELVQTLPASTCLAFFEEEAAKSGKIFKAIRDKGAVCECSHDSRQAVSAWLKKGFLKAGKKADADAVYAVIDRVGTDYERVKKEFDKIIAYGADSDVITKADVEAVTGYSIEAKTYEIVNACSQKNPEVMLEKYYALTEEEVHPLIILASLRSQFELMLLTDEMGKSGFSDREIGEKTKKADFIIRNNKKMIHNFRPGEIEDIIEKITLTDKQIKNGDANERTALELLLAEICARRPAAS